MSKKIEQKIVGYKVVSDEPAAAEATQLAGKQYYSDARKSIAP